MWLVLGVFFTVGLNNLHNLAFMGQDYSLHVICTEHLINNPGQWFTFDFTNRPLPYWIGVACHWLTLGRGGDVMWELASLVFVLLNTIALYVVHDTSRRLLASPLLRVAVLVLIAFLPSTLIASVVYAADATAQLPFVLAVWSLFRCAESATPRARAGYAGLAGLALCLGDFAKFTFLFLPVAAIFIAAALWRWRRIRGRDSLFMIGLAGVVPLLAGGLIQLAVQRDVAHAEPRHLFDWNWKGTGEMTWSSVLLVKRADVHILDAPGYWDPPDAESSGGHPLLASNRFSYPALFHLAVFTDVLDYANQGGNDNGTPRPEPQKSLSRVAVWLGLLFSVPAFLAVLALVGRMLAAVFRPRLAPATGLLIWGTMALVWYVPLVCVLPYLHNSYEWGYWLPRLVIPALWGFALVLFRAVEGLCAGRRRLVIALTALVLIQASVHIGSVWY